MSPKSSVEQHTLARPEAFEKGAPEPWGWRSSAQAPGEARHLTPTWDTGAHYFRDDCPCRPAFDADGFFVHNAYDGREQYEHGGRKRN